MTSSPPQPRPDAVAIVGIGCRFPGGVTDPASFWRLLSDGVDAITEVPSDRIDLDHYFDPRPATAGRMMSRWGGFIDKIEEFDPQFFGMSPREAQYVDPQQRLLLETAWEALEDAGQDVHQLDGSPTAVFVGQWVSDFESRVFSNPEGVDFHATTGSGRYAASGRISYVFGLRGPSLTLDSACSSSLAAVHLAVRSIRSGESMLALAGGANIILQPHISIAYSQNRMMAPDGHCKFGDASGDGYVRSEGVGLVALKSLERAMADGDRIYAVIRGSSVNNDGRSSGVLGRPSRVGHEEMLRSAYRDAGVSPSRVGYVEAHGTGTRAGDPVEVSALGAVLAPGRGAGERCFIGSVKTNIGHTEGAAGIAGLIKATLALHHGAIPASLHFVDPNPHVPWAELPFTVPTATSEWPAADGPRTAAVNSFGIAGTNAHVVLEQAPAAASASVASTRTQALLVLSAKSAEALRPLAERHAQQLRSARAPSLQDLCWTAATRCTPLEFRAAFVGSDTGSLTAQLDRYAAGEAAPAEGVADTAVQPRVVFVFPGQGAQWAGMARELMACEPVFLAALARCDEAARAWLEVSIVEQLALEPGDARYQLDRIDVIQPTLAALSIAYAALWRSLGVEPDAVVGHSMGEVAAAHVAGVLDIEQAMHIICRRSALMRRTSGQGAMALVELSMADAQTRIAGHENQVAVAVSNSPRSSVISGDPAVVQALVAELEREGVFCRLVKVDVASHSPQMEPLARELAAELSDMVPHAAGTALYSTVLGRRADGDELGAGYWASNLRQPVRFGATVEQLLADGLSVFIELGPHPVLLPSIQQTAQAAGRESTTIACARREEPEQAAMLAAVGALHCAGRVIDWRRVMPQGGRHVTLPAYPWQRERHWADAANMVPSGGQGPGRAVKSMHPVLGTGYELAGAPAGAVWGVSLEPARVPAWFEHGLHGSTVLPASAYLEMALAVARTISGRDAFAVRDLHLARALYLQQDEGGALQLQVTACADGSTQLEFQSHADTGWVLHARAALAVGPQPSAVAVDAAAVARLRALPAMAASDFYARLDAIGARFGPSLRAVTQVWLEPAEALAQVQAPAVPQGGERYCVPPALLDACFQVMVSLAPPGELWLPAELGSAHSLRAPTGESWIHATSTVSDDGASVGVDAVVFDAQGPALVLNGLLLKRLGAATGINADDAFYGVRWWSTPAAPTAIQRQWLLVPDTGGVGEGVASLLRQRGDTVHVASDPAQHLTALESALRDAPATLRTEVVDLRMLDVSAADGQVVAPLQGLLHTAQAIGGLRQATNVRLWLVTRGAAPADASAINPLHAPAWGLGAVLAAEHGDRWGGNIDLDPSSQTAAAAAAGLVDAIACDAGSLAVRAGQRLQPRLRRIERAQQASAPGWRKDASYLLTGGLGGVGLHVATWLVGEGVRHLVVMGRKPLPARTRWQAVSAASPEGRAIAAVKQLEALGASVHHVALDVADETALRGWRVNFEAEGRPPIRGVFHAAGITDDKLVHDLDIASLEAVLGPKLRGGGNLHRLFPELDRFVLFSSMAALMPQAGQASYAAANAYLDALAAQRRATGQHALSIGWGAWSQTGVMRGDTGQRQTDELARQGVGSFTPAQAVALLGDALRQPEAHVLVMPIDWARLRQSLWARAAPLLADLLAQAAAPAAAEPAVQKTSDPAERRRELERAVRDVVGRVLKLVPAKIDARKPLGSMGLTSLMALELRNRLEPLHGKPLSATLAWNYPTVDALVGFLAGDGDVSGGAAAAPATPSADVASVLGDVNQLSDEDAARQLRKRR